MANHPISIESAGGEYMESVLVVAWSAKPGQPVKAGDLLVTVETAKAATEVEADRDGWLSDIHYLEGQEAPVGAVLGTISDAEPQAKTMDLAPAQPSATASLSVTSSEPCQKAERSISTRVIASPLARRLAGQAGLDLSTVQGSGPHGRIKQRDVLKSIEGHTAKAQAIKSDAVAPRISTPEGSIPIVLLHGFGADRSAWRQVTPLLAKEYHTVALDLPGHGTSAEAPAGGIEDLASFVSDQLEAAGIERAHVVGHSLGGATALFLSAIGRVAVHSLTLFAPGGLGPEINGAFIAGLTGSQSASGLERWLAEMVGNAGDLPQGYASAVLKQMDRIGNRSALEGLARNLFDGNTQRFDCKPALQSVKVPTRIVWGRADRVIPFNHTQYLPDHAAVHLLSGIGHVPQMEAPAMSARLIMETVRSAG